MNAVCEGQATVPFFRELGNYLFPKQNVSLTLGRFTVLIVVKKKHVIGSTLLTK